MGEFNWLIITNIYKKNKSKVKKNLTYINT